MDEFRESLTGWDPRLIRLLSMATEARFWTLLQLPQETRKWTGEESHRVILIGDAAHAMTPYLYVVPEAIRLRRLLPPFRTILNPDLAFFPNFSAQGAAQAVEDGAFLGHLFDEGVVPGDVPARLKGFCERRQPRALAVRSRAQKAGEIYQLPDGPDQDLRDGQLCKGKLVEGFPNPFADSVLTRWLYEYNVEANANSCRTVD